MNEKWYVVVFEEFKTGFCEAIECDKSTVKRVNRGININLDHSRFFTEIMNEEKYLELQVEC